MISITFNMSCYCNENIESICKMVGQHIYDNNKDTSTDPNEIIDAEINDSLFAYYSLEPSMFSKFNTIYPSTAFKLVLGGLQKISIGKIKPTRMGTLEIVSNLKDFITNYMANYIPNYVTNNLVKFREGTALNLEDNEVNLDKACSSLRPFRRIIGGNSKCKSSIKFLMKEANPKIANYNSEFIFSHNLNLVLNDKNYAKLLSDVAVSLLNDFKNMLLGSAPPSDNIFERIQEIALKLGHNASVAKEMTLTILGTYAIRGAGYYEMLEFDQKKFSSTGPGISMLILSSFVSYFDKVTFYKYKKLFSLPGDYMKTTCLYGKPYHFWMSAYLSYLANQKGKYDIETSFNASHLLGVAYEIAPKKKNSFDARGHYVYSILHAKTSSDVNIYNMKIDLVFNSLGAGFGLWKQGQETINADRVLEKSFQSGSKFPVLLLPAKVISVPSTLYLITAPHSYIDLIKNVILNPSKI